MESRRRTKGLSISRRNFLSIVVPVILPGCINSRLNSKSDTENFIMTVKGPIAKDAMGFTLPHEHLFSIFGLDAEEKTEYNIDSLVSEVLPFLQKAKSAGCNTIIDCTAAYFGRSAEILKILSEKSGINILTNTGIYGAANGRYIPQYIHTDTAEQIASRWINEWKNGVGNTGFRPGFIKLGINSGPLSAVDMKLVHAGAVTHLSTGLTIAVHTTDNTEAAFKQLGILQENGVHPSAWIWTHAHVVTTNEPLLAAAKMGAWISFDGYRDERHERFLEGVHTMKDAGYIDRVLLSHDGNSYPKKGQAPSTASLSLLTNFIPALIKSGFTAHDIHQITVINPANAFAVKIRRI